MTHAKIVFNCTIFIGNNESKQCVYNCTETAEMKERKKCSSNITIICEYCTASQTTQRWIMWNYLMYNRIIVCEWVWFCFCFFVKVHERNMIIISHDENTKQAATKNKNIKSVYWLTERELSVYFFLFAVFDFVFHPTLQPFIFSFKFFDKCEH